MALDQMLRPVEVAARLGISRSTLYELVKRKMLKPASPIGLRAVGWRESEIAAYLESRAARGAA